MGPILTCNRSQLCMESLCRPWAQEMNKIHPCPGEMTHKAHVPGGLSLQNVSIYNPAPGKVSSLACSPRLRNSIRLAQLAAFLCLQGPQFCCKNDSLCHCWVLYLKQRESLGNERFSYFYSHLLRENAPYHTAENNPPTASRLALCSFNISSCCLPRLTVLYVDICLRDQ